MEFKQVRSFGGILAVFFACYLYLPSANAGILNDTEWKVTRGDTLFAIGRAVYPGDARKQARLRRDIMKLNPSIFVDGANNMGVGVVLKLPPYVSTESVVPKSTRSKYVAPKSTPPKVSIPVVIQTLVPPANNAPKPAPSEVDEPEPVPIPDKVTPRPAVEFVAPAPVVQPQPEAPTIKGQPTSLPSRAEGGAVVSLGFSYGGDKLIDVVDGADIFAGNGVQLRLGYEQMFQHGSGYRMSLGLQYYTLLTQDASFRDAYLQLAYQYRANPIVYGIGVVFDAGASLETTTTTTTTTEYDAAIGAVVYMEYVGSGELAGWGLSVTSLDIKEKNSGTSVDASRAELYYRWRF